MPKRSDSYMQERRVQILDAAIACITEAGWSRTTVDDVAAAAGLSKGAVYIHFASKRALLIGLLERNIAEIEARAGIDSYEALRADLIAGLDVLSGPRGWHIATGHLEAQLEGVRDPEVRDMLNRASSGLIDTLSGIVARLRPDLSSGGVRVLALSLILMLDGLRSFRTVSDRLSETVMRAIIDRQLKPLHPDAAGKTGAASPA